MFYVLVIYVAENVWLFQDLHVGKWNCLINKNQFSHFKEMKAEYFYEYYITEK